LTSEDIQRRRILWSSLVGVLVGGLVYLVALFNYDLDPGRSAVALRYASNFFDLQASAFMDGDLHLPDGALGIEGFVLDGRTYMYFGPFPALLRIPVLLVTDDFNGQLTVTYMLLAWMLFAVFCARLLWLVRRCLVGDREVTRLDAGLAAVVLAGATGGTVLTYDAALPWAYHEVYLWQAGLMIAAIYWMVRVVLDPSPAAVAWLSVSALGVCLTRTTGGWATCLAIAVLALWMLRGRTTRHLRPWWAWVLAAALVPFAVGLAVNVLKFRHPYLFPLENQVWTQVNEHRRMALEVNGGTITGPQFFWPALVNYFNPAGIRFVDYFPWVTLPASSAKGYGAFLDQSYRTGSVTAFMPLHLLLMAVATVVVARPTAHRANGAGIRALRPPAIATLLVTGGVMGYGYIAFRYISEFVPALVLGSMIALWAVVAPLAERSRAIAVPVSVVLVGGFAYSASAFMATGYASASTHFRGESVEEYVALQDRFSGGPDSPMSRLITHSAGLPRGGHTDQLHIRGDCDGLYLNTGDSYEPWIVVQERAHVIDVTFEDERDPGRVSLFRVSGNDPSTIYLETLEDGSVRLAIENSGGTYAQIPFTPAPLEILRIGLRTDSSLGYLEVESTPGGFVGFVPLQEWRRDWNSEINTVDSPIQSVTTVEDMGVTLQPRPGLDPPLCRQVAEHNIIDLR
jgi:hypothetical protein